MLGTIAAEAALSILVYQRTASALLSAMVLVCGFVPQAISGLLLSGIADRFTPRAVLIVSDLFCASCLAVMLVPATPIWLLLTLLACVGASTPIFQGARTVTLSSLLSGNAFASGRSLLRVISQVSVLVGFTAGGVAVAVVGPSWLLLADAASFVVSAALIAAGGAGRERPLDHGVDGGSRSALARESLRGLRFMTRRPLLWRAVVLTWSVPAAAAVADGLASALAFEAAGDAELAGFLFAAQACGSVVGQVLLTRRALGTKRKVVVPVAVLGLACLLPFFAGPNLPFGIALLFGVGLGSCFDQGLDPLILREAGRAMRGRTFTVQGAGLMTGQGVAIAIGGFAASVVAPSVVVGCAGVLGVAVALVLGRSLRRRGALDA